MPNVELTSRFLNGFHFSLKPPLVTKTDKSDDDGNNNTTQEKRLDYLLKQAAVYSHFVTKGSKAAAKGKRKILTSARSDRANK